MIKFAHVTGVDAKTGTPMHTVVAVPGRARMTAILAMSQDGAIGDTSSPGGMPWPRLARDMRRFREATMNKVCIVGRKTAELLPPLKGRALVVASRRSAREFTKPIAGPVLGFAPNLLHTTEDLRIGDLATDGFDPSEVFVIGGAEIYRALLPRCDRVLLTTVSASYPGADVRLDPAEVTDGRRCLSTEWHAADSDNPAGLRFSEWVRP